MAQIWRCCGRGVGRQLTAPIGPLGWLPPYATGVALKKKTKQKKKKQQKKKPQTKETQRPKNVWYIWQMALSLQEAKLCYHCTHFLSLQFCVNIMLP